MSYVAPAEHAGSMYDDWDLPQEQLPLAHFPLQAPRSIFIPIAFLLPVILSAVSWFSGGLALLSDTSMLIITILCAALLFVELLHFGTRFGIGAIVLYGGVLIWFCHDYLFNWFLHDFNIEYPAYPGVTAQLISRVVFFHCVFIELMVIAFRIPVGRWAERLVTAVPEPADERFYLWIVSIFFIFGLSAFLFSTESFPIAVLKVPFQQWVGPVEFTVSRTGNMNYNWGGYVAQIIQMGEVGGLLGAAYALLVARGWLGRFFGLGVWAYWTADVLPTGRRGYLAFMLLPFVGMVFLKYHAQAAAQLRRRNLRALLVLGVLCICVWGAVARETAIRSGDDSIQWFRVAGNSMFSEGLRAWELIPSERGYAFDTFPGATFLRPIPDSVWSLVSGLVPRTIWAGKGGADEFVLWYDSYISGDRRAIDSGGVVGTTISSGAVGYWYFRYGPIGVIEGGLFYGWLLGVSERAFRMSLGKPLKMLFALSFATFMFRSYRDLWWHNIDGLLLGGIGAYIIIKLFFSAPPQPLPMA
jgi:hypothetical protein